MQGDSSLLDAGRLDYLDFELEIRTGTGREYPVTVIHSPAGEAREMMRFPFDALVLESRLDKLQIALLRSGGKRRRVPSREEQTVQDFGRELFDALFCGEVRSRYDVSQQEAARQGKGLRIKLRIQTPELAALPWEFLYDPRQAEYVCLSRSTPVVRYLELSQPIQPLAVTPPLRILGLVCSPRNLPELDEAREKERVEQAIRDLRAQGLVELTWLEGQTWRELQRAMRSGPWHVFHFAGHGHFDQIADEGFIALSDKDGGAHQLSATQLGRLLADHRSLRLVLLNSCEGARGGKVDIFSSTASILVRRGIPAVLAMQYEVTDNAAIEFSRAFYEALADGMPVDASVAEARKSISLAVTNSVEWGIPALYMRSPNGVLFDVEAKPMVSLPPNTTWSRLRSLPAPAWGGLLALVLLLSAGAVALGLYNAGGRPVFVAATTSLSGINTTPATPTLDSIIALISVSPTRPPVDTPVLATSTDTPIPPTPTLTHTPVPPTPTGPVSPAPTVTLSPTSIPTLFISRTPAPSPPAPTATLALQSASMLPAPTILGPEVGANFVGPDAQITLKWSAVKESLSDDEIYLITIPYQVKPSVSGQEGAVWSDYAWTQQTSWLVNEHPYLLDSSVDGQFSWSVTLIKQTGTNISGVPEGDALSKTSEKRTFVWLSTAPGSGGPEGKPPPPP